MDDRLLQHKGYTFFSKPQADTTDRSVPRCLLQRETGFKRKLNAVPKEFQWAAEDKLVLKDHEEMRCQLPGTTTRSTFLMVFSPDGKRVASTHGNHNIYVTDLTSGKNINTLSGHPRTPWCIAFHPSSNQILASGCLGGQVRVWDLSGGSEMWITKSQTVIASIAFHPTERMLVIATYNELYFWDWSRPEPYAKCHTSNEKEKVRYVSFDPLGCKLITGISNAPPITTLWDRCAAPSCPGNQPSAGASTSTGTSAGSANEQRITVCYRSLVEQYEQLVQRYYRLTHSRTTPTMDRGTDPMDVDNAAPASSDRQPNRDQPVYPGAAATRSPADRLSSYLQYRQGFEYRTVLRQARTRGMGSTPGAAPDVDEAPARPPLPPRSAMSDRRDAEGERARADVATMLHNLRRQDAAARGASGRDRRSSGPRASHRTLTHVVHVSTRGRGEERPHAGRRETPPAAATRQNESPPALLTRRSYMDQNRQRESITYWPRTLSNTGHTQFDVSHHMPVATSSPVGSPTLADQLPLSSPVESEASSDLEMSAESIRNRRHIRTYELNQPGPILPVFSRPDNNTPESDSSPSTSSPLRLERVFNSPVTPTSTPTDFEPPLPVQAPPPSFNPEWTPATVSPDRPRRFFVSQRSAFQRHPPRATSPQAARFIDTLRRSPGRLSRLYHRRSMPPLIPPPPPLLSLDHYSARASPAASTAPPVVPPLVPIPPPHEADPVRPEGRQDTTSDIGVRYGIQLLSRHIDNMQRLCRARLEILQLQQIRRMWEDLQRQIRSLHVAVRESSLPLTLATAAAGAATSEVRPVFPWPRDPETIAARMSASSVRLVRLGDRRNAGSRSMARSRSGTPLSSPPTPASEVPSRERHTFRRTSRYTFTRVQYMGRGHRATSHLRVDPRRTTSTAWRHYSGRRPGQEVGGRHRLQRRSTADSGTQSGETTEPPRGRSTISGTLTPSLASTEAKQPQPPPAGTCEATMSNGAGVAEPHPTPSASNGSADDVEPVGGRCGQNDAGTGNESQSTPRPIQLTSTSSNPNHGHSTSEALRAMIARLEGLVRQQREERGISPSSQTQAQGSTSPVILPTLSHQSQPRNSPGLSAEERLTTALHNEEYASGLLYQCAADNGSGTGNNNERWELARETTRLRARQVLSLMVESLTQFFEENGLSSNTPHAVLDDQIYNLFILLQLALELTDLLLAQLASTRRELEHQWAHRLRSPVAIGAAASSFRQDGIRSNRLASFPRLRRSRGTTSTEVRTPPAVDPSPTPAPTAPTSQAAPSLNRTEAYAGPWRSSYVSPWATLPYLTATQQEAEDRAASAWFADYDRSRRGGAELDDEELPIHRRERVESAAGAATPTPPTATATAETEPVVPAFRDIEGHSRTLSDLPAHDVAFMDRLSRSVATMNRLSRTAASVDGGPDLAEVSMGSSARAGASRDTSARARDSYDMLPFPTPIDITVHERAPPIPARSRYTIEVASNPRTPADFSPVRTEDGLDFPQWTEERSPAQHEYMMRVSRYQNRYPRSPTSPHESSNVFSVPLVRLNDVLVVDTSTMNQPRSGPQSPPSPRVGRRYHAQGPAGGEAAAGQEAGDRPWRSRFLHPRYRLDHMGRERSGEQAGTAGDGYSGLRGVGTDHVVVTDSQVMPNHRIQAWNFSTAEIPDISDVDKNIVAAECKIHNDASVDVSSDGLLLVTLLPSGRHSMTTMLGIYSLEWPTLGQCLYTTSFDQNAVSVSLSPVSRHLLVGLASRRTGLMQSDRHTMAQIFRLDGARPGSGPSVRGRLCHLRDIEQCRDQPFMSINCIRWAPRPGQGFVYGSNNGQLKVLR